jgi:transcriptional accessory protein Tex/SPT6
VVKVRVVEVDETLKRIALSMKSEQSPGAPAGPGSGQALPAARPQSRQPAPADLRPKGQAGGQPPLKTYKPKFSVKQFMK